MGQEWISPLRNKDFRVIFIVKAKFLTIAMWPFAHFEGLVAPMNLNRRMMVT